MISNIPDHAHPGYFISAPWRSSGKTIFTLGLAHAAKRLGHTTQTFKKGPDFIDPLWLAAASGNGCYNLDPYIQQNNQWIETFNKHAGRAAINLVEGTMGLHDGLESDGSDSNASVARALNLPVILVVDCRGMHRTVAALLNGVQKFDPSVQFAGVVLNRIRSSRHEDKVRTALEDHTDIKLLGALPETRNVHINEKQLGLTPVTECAQIKELVGFAADLVTEHCDLNSLFGQVREVKSSLPNGDDIPVDQGEPMLRVGIARDEAFHFYYQDDLDTFAEKGVELVEVSPLRDSFPDDLDGFIIGGGFPERHAEALSRNVEFIHGLKHSIEAGLAIHAECGGLMYLCKRLKLDQGSFNMVGIIDGDVHMCRKPQGRGYMKLQRGSVSGELRAHEFHHSKISFEKPQKFIFRVTRGHGIDGVHDGIQIDNVQAGFAHFRQTVENPWIDNFLDRIVTAKRQSPIAGNPDYSWKMN